MAVSKSRVLPGTSPSSSSSHNATKSPPPPQTVGATAVYVLTPKPHPPNNFLTPHTPRPRPVSQKTPSQASKPLSATAPRASRAVHIPSLLHLSNADVCLCPRFVDVHVSADNVVVMFHDPGLIRERNWYGENGMEHVRTAKEPKQPIPTFTQAIELLMRPENLHAQFDVDVKIQNDPERLFGLMHDIISAQPDWETKLAPRIILGLWHPRFVAVAKARMPYCRRSYIGNSIYVARKYFWKDCEAFSMAFACLTGADGLRWVSSVSMCGWK
ncbi:hypothetical protein H0H92_010490 [Tricholoma furcatifolium]|nr:hypothetical protein H0H92_010490 [Tricholoma furcatifolium]